jgi:hypothetical protein
MVICYNKVISGKESHLEATKILCHTCAASAFQVVQVEVLVTLISTFTLVHELLIDFVFHLLSYMSWRGTSSCSRSL